MPTNDTTEQFKNEIPHGYCMCGCGKLAPVAAKNSYTVGWIKGQPKRYVRGHQNRRPLAKRFWEKVDRRGPDECWLWIANTNASGYGTVVAARHSQLAHRIAWELENGSVPDGLCVLHRCDVNYPVGDLTNRRCVNPAHLWLGTVGDNTRDMVAKGRNYAPRLSGESNPSSKLTEQDVRDIRSLAASGVSRRAIAEKFGISYFHVFNVIRRETWKHIE